MNDPHEVLGLPPDADEAAIRRRYLELVREAPPDRAPERFAAVRSAYDALRDPGRRLSSQIFEVSTDDTLEALAAEVRSRLLERLGRLPTDALLALADSP